MFFLMQSLHSGIAWYSLETVMHISVTIRPLQVPQKVWVPFLIELSPKKQDFLNSGSLRSQRKAESLALMRAGPQLAQRLG